MVSLQCHQQLSTAGDFFNHHSFDLIKADEDDYYYYSGDFSDHNFAEPNLQARDISRKMGTLPKGGRRGSHEGKGRFRPDFTFLFC